MIKDISITLKDFLHFLKSPRDRFSDRITAHDRYRIFTVLLFCVLLINVVFIMPLLGWIEENVLELKISGILTNFTIWGLLFIGAIFAPLWEELVFRFPLKPERNYLVRLADKIVGKPLVSIFWQRNFKIIFYLVAILFGLIHSLNFENEWNWLFILLLPILILSQSVTGLFLGYIRLRLGFFWAVLFHGCFNFVVITVGYLSYQPTELINHKNSYYELRVESLFCRESSSTTISHEKSDDEKFLMIGARNVQLQTMVDLTARNKYIVSDNGILHFYFKSEKGLTEQELINLLKEEFEITEK